MEFWLRVPIGGWRGLVSAVLRGCYGDLSGCKVWGFRTWFLQGVGWHWGSGFSGVTVRDLDLGHRGQKSLHLLRSIGLRMSCTELPPVLFGV